jgi:hypothetical protein
MTEPVRAGAPEPLQFEADVLIVGDGRSMLRRSCEPSTVTAAAGRIGVVKRQKKSGTPKGKKSSVGNARPRACLKYSNQPAYDAPHGGG